MAIHPSAVIEEGAQIDPTATVGAFCVVGAQVVLGPDVVLKSHVVVTGQTTIGAGTVIFPFAVIGEIPQDLKFKGEASRLEIGARNRIREHVTMNCGTEGGGGVTRVGDDNLFMAGWHIGLHLDDRISCLRDPPFEVAVFGKDLGQPHDAQLGHVKAAFQPFGLHLHAADALKYHIRAQRLQPRHQRSAQLVARRLTGEDKDAQGGHSPVRAQKTSS